MLFPRCFLSMGSASGYRFDDAAVRCLAVMLFEECVFLPLLDFSLKQLPNCLKKKKKKCCLERRRRWKCSFPTTVLHSREASAGWGHPAYSVVKNLLPLVLSWEQGTCLLGLLLHPSDEMHLVHLGCVLQGTEPKFWHCCNAHVSP